MSGSQGSPILRRETPAKLLGCSLYGANGCPREFIQQANMEEAKAKH